MCFSLYLFSFSALPFFSVYSARSAVFFFVLWEEGGHKGAGGQEKSEENSEMIKKPQDTPIVVKRLYDLALWYLQRIEKFPKAYRYTLGEKLQASLLEVLELLVEASYAKNKKTPLEQANRRLHRVRILTRLASDLRCLSLNQQEFVAREADEVGRQIGGWLRSRREEPSSDVPPPTV